MSFQCKIAVLGPTVRDHITTPNEEVIEKYGGVSNPCIALAKLLESSGSEIFPVTHVRKRDEQNILDLLRPFENITLDYISSDADQGDVIRLQFLDTNKRSEKMSAFMTPITPDDVKNLLFCDAFLMVPVTESEITLDTLKFIKDYSDSLTLFDAHGPTTLMTVLGDRLPKFWIDRDRWLPYIDILKMNMEEVKSCWFREKYKLSELESDYDFNSKELPDFAKHCIDMGVKAVCVTRDANGCSLYFEEDGEIKEHLIEGIHVDKVIDTTGCGDSFAAGFVFGTLATGSYVKGAQYANALGALRTQGSSFDVFLPYEETKQLVERTYGEID